LPITALKRAVRSGVVRLRLSVVECNLGPRAAPAPIACQKRQAGRAAPYAATGQHQIVEPSPAGARLMLRSASAAAPDPPRSPLSDASTGKTPQSAGFCFCRATSASNLVVIKAGSIPAPNPPVRHPLGFRANSLQPHVAHARGADDIATDNHPSLVGAKWHSSSNSSDFGCICQTLPSAKHGPLLQLIWSKKLARGTTPLWCLCPERNKRRFP
jgi:hypothetical protein